MVLEEGQLHLHHALPAGGVLGEDVQDQRLPVHHVHLEQLLQVALLGRGELVVEHHHIDVEGAGQLHQLLRLAPADEGGGVGGGTAHQLGVHGVGAGGVGEQCQLLQRALGIEQRVASQHHPHQEGALTQAFYVGDGGG